jgi:hypothetical protein
LTTIVGTLGALILGGAVGTFTLMGVVNNQTSPKGDSPASVSSPQDEISYGSTE